MIDKRLLLRRTALGPKEGCNQRWQASIMRGLQISESMSHNLLRLLPSCESCPLRPILRSTPCPIRFSCPVYLHQCSRALFSTSLAGSSDLICVWCATSQDKGYVKCDQCGRLRSFPCNSPPSYFELLAGNVSFKVDIPRMRQRYLQLQRTLHPDNYAGPTQGDEPSHAANWSSYVNRAYETLRDPLKRAIYLVRQGNMSRFIFDLSL